MSLRGASRLKEIIKISSGFDFDSKRVDKIICWDCLICAVLLEFRLLEFLPMCIVYNKSNNLLECDCFLLKLSTSVSRKSSWGKLSNRARNFSVTCRNKPRKYF